MSLRNLAFVLLVATPAYAELPAHIEIDYELRRNGSITADISAVLEQGGGEYRLVERWHGRGLFALLGRATRTSLGSVLRHGVRVREFTDERSGRDTARAWFDWKSNLLTSRYKGKTRTEAIPPNAQDRISFLLALALAPAGAKALDVHLVDGRGTSHHVYDFLRRERVQTPAGEFEALVVGRGSADDERLEMWLADALGRLPVRMLVVEKNGNRYDQVAVRISR
ncbi:MAG TPA: DUF3108 domain-containing protein [Burkholderiales bacterium]|jgi:hypothetical protein